MDVLMERFKRDFRENFVATRQKIRPRGVKFWLNVVTLALVADIVIAAQNDIFRAFQEIGHANWAVLLLIIPVQFASYYAGTEVFLTYLRGRGKLKNVSSLEATAMSLELNFVNHVFPSGGVSGIGYMSWRLSKLGVPAGQSTMAQVMKYVVQFGVFVALMVLALIWTTVTNQTANWVAAATTLAITALVLVVAFGSYLVGSRDRMVSFAHFFTRHANDFVRFLTRGRTSRAFDSAKIERFFLDFHDDFTALRAEKSLLVGPALWSLVFTVFDVGLFVVSFASLGVFVNPAVLFIAYGAATLSGMFMVTPGGAGAYEAIMIGILTASSVAPGVAFAGVILARVILILLTLVTGFFAYQIALKKYGQPEEKSSKSLKNFAPKSAKIAQKSVAKNTIFEGGKPEKPAPKMPKRDENLRANFRSFAPKDKSGTEKSAQKIAKNLVENSPKNAQKSPEKNLRKREILAKIRVKNSAKKSEKVTEKSVLKTPNNREEMAKYFDDITIDGEKL